MFQVFQFDSKQLRTVEGADGEIYLVGKDACEILDMADHKQALERLDDDEKGVATVQTAGGPQEMIIINESGLYNLTFTSRKAEAKRFRKWVTSEVLPSIRKTGSYTAKLPIKQAVTNELQRMFSDHEALEKKLMQELGPHEQWFAKTAARMRHNAAEVTKTVNMHWVIANVLQELKFSDKPMIEPGLEAAVLGIAIEKVKPNATGEMLYCVGFRPLSKLFKATSKPEIRLVEGDAST